MVQQERQGKPQPKDAGSKFLHLARFGFCVEGVFDIDGLKHLDSLLLVGVRRFELPAPASRRQCSTRLSYTPCLCRHVAGEAAYSIEGNADLEAGGVKFDTLLMGIIFMSRK